MLAAGAWLKGGVSLEEYNSDKVHQDVETGRSYRSHGRVDLYMKVDETTFEIEAKQRWISSSSRSVGNLVRNKMKEAKDDARATRGAENRIGCVFFVPRFKEAKYPNYESQSTSIIKAHIEAYLEIKSVHLWAWSFPETTRRTYVEKESSYYPGVIMGMAGVKYSS
jgi:hypothetical protein